MNEAEQRFAGYLDDHGYQWKFEPDYRTEFALDARLRTNPDFLVSRDSVRAVCEVRQFETDGIYGALAGTSGVGSLDSKPSMARFGRRSWRRRSSCVHSPGSTFH
jgi:hypothetical protein